MPARHPIPRLGQEAKQRSTHNNYLTLPVIFLMLSNHYPLAWSSRYAVAIVGLVVIAGAVIRHFFNSQHAGKGSPLWTWALAAVCIGWPVWLSILGKPGYRNMAEAGPAATPAMALAASDREAVLAIQSRCSMCHAEEPAWDGIPFPPKGVRLDTPEEIARHAGAIRIQSVLTHAMPPNNLTDMTLDERRVVATWLGRSGTPSLIPRNVTTGPETIQGGQRHVRTHSRYRADHRVSRPEGRSREDRSSPCPLSSTTIAGALKAAASEDGTSLKRAEIASGKAYGALSSESVPAPSTRWRSTGPISSRRPPMWSAAC